MPGVGCCKRRKVVTPLARLRGVILHFGQNAVKTPGRTHDNHCVTKGLKVSLKPFQRLAGPGQRPGRSPQGAKLLSHLSGGSIFLCLLSFCDRKRKEEAAALQSSTPQIHPSGVFCADGGSNRVLGPLVPRPVTSKGRRQAALKNAALPYPPRKKLLTSREKEVIIASIQNKGCEEESKPFPGPSESPGS